MPQQRSFHSKKRPVKIVLVVDRVELKAVNERQKVRHFHRNDPVLPRKEGDAAHKIIHIGDMRKHIVRNDKICWPTTASDQDIARSGPAEKAHQGGDTSPGSNGSNIRCWFDPKAWDVSRNKISQKIPVVACDFDDKALGIERTSRDH